MNTITEYQYLSNDMINIGIAETIVKVTPILTMMPFQEVAGNAYKYNLEKTLANAQFYADNEQWVESTPKWEQRSVGLTILGDDADVSNFAQKTMSNLQDQKASVIELAAKAVAHRFERAVIYGGTTDAPDADEFKGMLQLLAECESSSATDLDSVNNGQVIAAAAASGALTLTKLDELIDAVPGGPDFLMLSKRTRRKINVLARTASGSPLQWTQEQFGLFIQRYNGLPIFINEFMKDNLQDGSASVLDITAYTYATTRASGYDNSAIIAGKFGLKGLHGIHNGGIQREEIGTLEKKDASRTRIKFYCGIVLESTIAGAVLINFNPDD